MKEQKTQNTLKKLSNRNQVFKLSSLSKVGTFIFCLPCFLWGIYLIYRMDGNMFNFIFPFAVVLLVVPIISFLPEFFPAYKNSFVKEYNPFKQARKHLLLIVIMLVFFFSILLPFVFIVFKKPIDLFTLILLIPIFFVGRGLIVISIEKIKEYINMMVNGIRYGLSKIQLLEQPVILGGKFSIRFENQSSNITGKRLQASLRNISEIMEYTSKEDSSKSAVVYQRYEKVIPFVMEEPQKILRFQIPAIDTVPTNIVGLEPDYWELEIQEEEGPYFARFLLDVR